MTTEKLIAIIIILVLILVVIGVIVLVVHRIRNKLRQFSRAAFGTDSLTEGWQKQARELATIPKSVSGMTRIYEPQIQKDFPEFNWMQFRNRAENMLISAFAAITGANIGLLQEVTPDLKAQVENQITANGQQGVQEVYRQVKIHQTEIARYEKKQGKCIVTLQSAVEYYHYKEQDGKIVDGNKDLMEQTKYNIELMYVQDPQKANVDRSLGLTCPNCGAPVTKLGASKYCEYCGSGVTPVNIQVWHLQKYYEVDYHRV